MEYTDKPSLRRQIYVLAVEHINSVFADRTNIDRVLHALAVEAVINQWDQEEKDYLILRHALLLLHNNPFGNIIKDNEPEFVPDNA